MIDERHGGVGVFTMPTALAGRAAPAGNAVIWRVMGTRRKAVLHEPSSRQDELAIAQRQVWVRNPGNQFYPVQAGRSWGAPPGSLVAT